MRIEQAMGRLPGELKLLGSLTAARGTAIDVGANRGYYSYAMTKIFREVVALEPNEALTRDLARCGARNLTIHSCGLSSAAGEMDLHIPIVDGREYVGWASFERDYFQGAGSYRVLKVPVRRLDDLDLADVSLVKINAPTHEAEVLEGGRRTIEASRPAVIAQIEPANRRLFDRALGDLGLAPHIAEGGRLLPLPGGSERYAGEKIVFVFVPAGR
jgi:FkbM family methyltransferase